MAYTRDQWLNKCAERLRDKHDMEPGEAAAYAIMLHDQQVSENGRTPHDWIDPSACADADMNPEPQDNSLGTHGGVADVYDAMGPRITAGRCS